MTNETSKESTLDPVAVPKDDGEARWWFGLLAVIKATAPDRMLFILITLAALIASLAAADVAAAAYAYQQSDFTAPDAQQTGHTQECKQGLATSGGAVGGGVYADLVLLNSSYPSTPDDWTVWVDNYAGGAASNFSRNYVVCDTNADGTDYVREVENNGLVVPDDSQGTAKIKCGGGNPVVGGGAVQSGFYADEQYLTSSAPYDGADGNDKPDDGWKVTANNDEDGAANDATVDLYAICDSRRSLSKYDYVERRVTVRDAKLKADYRPCPGEHPAAGGGVESHAAYRHGLYINNTFPLAVASPDRDTRGWSASVINYDTPDDKARDITIHAICRS